MKRKSLAIPIRCVDYSNSSQIVSFFSREEGLLEGIAKGAYREKSPFQGPFDLATAYEVVHLERRSVGLSILTEATVLEGFRGLRRSWARFVGACHMIEMLRAVVVGRQAEGELFDLVWGAFAELSTADCGDAGAILAAFDVRALRSLGFLGPLDACVVCGRPWESRRQAVVFEPRTPGIVCRGCRSAAGGGRSVPGEVVDGLDRLLESAASPLDLPAFRLAWDRHRPATHRLVRELRTSLLERRLGVLQSAASWTR